MPAPGTIRLVDPDGVIRDVDTATAASQLQDPRWRVAATEDELGRVDAQAKEEAYGGAGGAVKAGAAAIARGATLGLSDLAARGIGGEDAAIALEGLREAHPYASTGGEVIGALAPALLTGGSSAGASAGEIGAGVAARGLASRLPAAAVSRLGAGIAHAGAEAGLAAKVGYAALGGAAEGALYGAGTGISEASLADRPLDIEHVAAAIGSNALYGAGLGGAIGGAGKLAEVGLARAKGAIDSALERRAVKARTPAEGIDTGDLELLDVPKLQAARQQELEAIHAARDPVRAKIVDDLKDYRNSAYEEDLFKQHYGVDNGFIREAGGSLKKADRRIRDLLDKEVVLAKRPERALEHLQQEEQAMSRLHQYGRDQIEHIAEQLDTLPQTLRADIAAGKVPGSTGPFTDAGLDFATELHLPAARAALKKEQEKLYALVDKMSPAIGRNRDLQAAIENVGRPAASERLSKIDAALEVLAQPRQPSFADAAIGLAAPFAGPLGVAAAAGARTIGGLRKLAAAATERTGKTVSAFLGGTAKVAPVVPPLATKVLTSVRYGGDRRSEPETTLPAAYKARSDEIKRQVHIAPDGSYQMRPEARARMAAKLDGIRVADPRAADHLETAGARRIAWLASQLPKRPDTAGIQVGPDTWSPPELEMRSWARKVSAAEDPNGVFGRLVDGTVTPEDAEAMRAVHPEILADLVSQITTQLPTLRATLPHHRLVALSILTGMPVSPSMDPAVLGLLQAQYTYEPEKPRAQPQFGSVKNTAEPGTASQRREEGSAT